MNRRDVLKTLGLAGLCTETVAALETAQAVSKDAIQHYADAVEQFSDKAGSLQPPAITLPYATIPVNVYTRVSQTTADKAAPPDALWPLVKQLKKYEGFDTVKAVGMELWRRWRPRGQHFRQVTELETSPKALVTDGPAVYYGYKKVVRTGALIDRIITPRYTVDLQELYPYHLATMLSSIRDLTQEMQRITLEAHKKWTELGNSSFKYFLSEYTPVVVEVDREMFLISFTSHCLMAGIIK